MIITIARSGKPMTKLTWLLLVVMLAVLALAPGLMAAPPP